MGCEASKPLTPPGGRGPTMVDERQQDRNNLEAKIVLLGDSGVGKSSLALRYTQGRFSPFHEVTIGAAFLQQLIRLRDGTQLKLHIWDTGGQERFRAMAPLYYRDAMGAVIVYDCTDEKSFESVKYWLNELRNKGPPNVCLAVVGNKCDVEDKKVDTSDAKAFCDENDMLYIEASAKTGENVLTVFSTLANKIYQELQSVIQN